MSLDEVDDSGNTALHYAVFNVRKATNSKEHDSSEVLGPLISSVSLLLRHGANPRYSPFTLLFIYLFFINIILTLV